MPRKKENSTSPLPGFDIFGQPMTENDRGILLKLHYRRKQLAGFVPLWNEFFRCYHLAGVSPTSAYLWAYLRQYEHERREWNAISDISWPGRRDMAEALGVSISHLPNLLNELRQAGLISFQPVLPGFEDLAETLNVTNEEVRERAADYGVNPKVDGTLYRTADPFTKTEFATLTSLKFCKGCKAYRYCEGVKEARTHLNENNNRTGGNYAPPLTANPKQPLPAPVIERKINLETDQEVNLETALPRARRTQERTATVSKKVQQVIPDRVGGRIEETTESVSKKVQQVNPSRVKTNLNKPTPISQPEINTTMTAETTRSNEKLVVVKNQIVNKEQSNISQKETSPELDLLLRFGFDTYTANQLFQQAASYGKETGYIRRIIQYARENARQNPQGMVRRLIERGEERLSRADRWQQQSLFESSEPEVALIGSEIEQQDLPNSATTFAGQADEKEESAALTRPTVLSEQQLDLQAHLASAYELQAEELVWWNGLVKQLAVGGQQAAAEIFGSCVGVRQPGGRLIIIVRSLFDQHRVITYTNQLERIVANVTGQLPWIEFVICSR